jgi:endonuclease III
VKTTGFYHNKAKNIKACCQQIIERHGGKIPKTLDELSALSGVGRKTANVVLGNAFGIPGLVVDTHVGRLSRRMGFTENEDAVKVEFDLMDIFPKEEWTELAHLLISHGREVCLARRAECERCFLAHGLCPRIGVDKKTGKPRTE